jgi:hypothetical protein
VLIRFTLYEWRKKYAAPVDKGDEQAEETRKHVRNAIAGRVRETAPDLTPKVFTERGLFTPLGDSNARTFNGECIAAK